MNVLIVEDELNLRNSMSWLLRSSNYNVMMAEHGKEALDLLNSGYMPDIILSDIVMPEMSGITFFNELQKDNRFRFIPFIFLTAKAGIDDIREGMGMGVDDYITKPVKYEDIVRAIEKRVQKKLALSEEIAHKVMSTISQPNLKRKEELNEKLELISTSEKRVLSALAEDKISKIIADKLYLSIKTVQNHRSNMSIKLGLSGQNSLLPFAVECKALGLL